MLIDKKIPLDRLGLGKSPEADLRILSAFLKYWMDEERRSSYSSSLGCIKELSYVASALDRTLSAVPLGVSPGAYQAAYDEIVADDLVFVTEKALSQED